MTYPDLGVKDGKGRIKDSPLPKHDFEQFKHFCVLVYRKIDVADVSTVFSSGSPLFTHRFNKEKSIENTL